MSRVLLALLFVAAVSAGIVWSVTREDGGRARRTQAPSVTTAPEPAPPPETPALQTAPLAEAARPAQVVPARSEPVPAAREAVGAISAEQLARAHWVAGHVVFPEGTPADEELFVTADGRDFEEQQDHRVKVARDGSFRVAFSEKSRSGRLELTARYLYLAEPVRWKKGESSAQLVLEPVLGARIVGRVRAPASADPAPIGGKLSLSVTRVTSNHSSQDQVATRTLAPDLAFAFDALVPMVVGQGHYELDYDGERLVGRSARLNPEPGRTLELELELSPGVTLAGVVRDEQGAALAGVRLDADVATRSDWSEAHYRHGTSAADGSFRLGALVAGEIALRADLQNYLPLEKELGELAPGTDLAGIELVLARGRSIAGRVLWPDGSPAEATLTLEPIPDSPNWSKAWNSASGKCDLSGTFSISGLSAISIASRPRPRRPRRSARPASSPGASARRSSARAGAPSSSRWLSEATVWCSRCPPGSRSRAA